MGKKKRKVDEGPKLQDLLDRMWCYYCERDFDDQKVLIQHMKAKHLKCSSTSAGRMSCNKRMTTAGGLSIHMRQVHKETLEEIENALPHRSSPSVEVFGMMGIPEDVMAAHVQRVTQAFFAAKKDKEEKMGILPGSTDDAGPSVDGQPQKKKVKVEAVTETIEEMAARAKIFREKRRAAKERAAQGLPPLPEDDAKAASPDPASNDTPKSESEQAPEAHFASPYVSGPPNGGSMAPDHPGLLNTSPPGYGFNVPPPSQSPGYPSFTGAQAMHNTYAPQGHLPMNGHPNSQYPLPAYQPQSQHAAFPGPPTGYGPGPYTTGSPMGYGQTAMNSPYASGPPMGYGQTSSASPYPPVHAGPSPGYSPGPQQPFHMSAAQVAQQQALQRVRDQQSSIPSQVPFTGPQTVGGAHRPPGLPAKPSFQAPNMSKEEMALLHGEANFWPNGTPIRADPNASRPPKAPEIDYRQQSSTLHAPNTQGINVGDAVDDLINSVTRQGPYATNASQTSVVTSARPVYDPSTGSHPRDSPEAAPRRSPPKPVHRNVAEPVVPHSAPPAHATRRESLSHAPVNNDLFPVDQSMATKKQTMAAKKETTEKSKAGAGKVLKYVLDMEREVAPEEQLATMERYQRWQHGNRASTTHAMEGNEAAPKAGQVGDILAEDARS